MEENTLKTRQKVRNILKKKKISMPLSGYPEHVSGIGEAVDER